MAYQSHKGTAGHTIATDILSDGKKSAGKSAGVDFHHIRVEKAANGITVSHTLSTPASHAEPAPEEQLHVFRDATQAHQHLGQLLGVRMASGQETV